MKIKKLISSVVLAATLLLSFSSTVFAVTVSPATLFSGGGQYGPNIVHDMVINSSGVYMAVNSSNSSDNLNHLYYMPSNNDPAYTEVEIDTASNGTNYYASIAIDSSGYPGIAWRELNQSGNTAKLYYKKYNGTSWGNTIEVATGLEVAQAVPALGFYRDGGDANYPTIISCAIGGGVYIAEYKATSANQNPSFAAPVTISNNASHGCSGADLIISSTDTLILAVAPATGNSTSYNFNQESGSWGSASTIFTGVDVTGGLSGISIDINSDNATSAVIIDDASGSSSDSMLYNVMTSGSWGTQQTIASGVRLGQLQIDVAIDSTNNIPYVFYSDNANNKLKYAYYSNSTWTAADMETGYTFATFSTDYQNYITGGYYSGGSKIIVFATIYYTGPNNIYKKYELTDLVSGGGGQGGGGAPEFSTFVYVATALLMFGMVYWKSEDGMVQNA